MDIILFWFMAALKVVCVIAGLWIFFAVVKNGPGIMKDTVGLLGDVVSYLRQKVVWKMKVSELKREAEEAAKEE